MTCPSASSLKCAPLAGSPYAGTSTGASSTRFRRPHVFDTSMSGLESALQQWFPDAAPQSRLHMLMADVRALRGGSPIGVWLAHLPDGCLHVRGRRCRRRRRRCCRCCYRRLHCCCCCARTHTRTRARDARHGERQRLPAPLAYPFLCGCSGEHCCSPASVRFVLGWCFVARVVVPGYGRTLHVSPYVPARGRAIQ